MPLTPAPPPTMPAHRQGLRALLKDEPWAAERRSGGLAPSGLPGVAGGGGRGRGRGGAARPKTLVVPSLAACVEYTGQACDCHVMTS